MCADRLEKVFASFAVFGKGNRGSKIASEDIRMDSKAFSKLMKDAGLMYGKLNLTRVDLCYTKCCEKVCFTCCATENFALYVALTTNDKCDRVQVSKRMSLEQFLHGLAECAAARGDDLHMFKQAVANCQPMVHATVAGRVKWCASSCVSLVGFQSSLCRMW